MATMRSSRATLEALQRAAPTGSSAYYALRLAPADRRPALEAIVGLAGEIRRIPAETTETDIGRARLRWWRSELARILEGGGTHPLAAPLRRAIAHHPRPGEELRALLEEAERALDGALPPTASDQFEAARRRAAAPARLAARVLADDASGPWLDSEGEARPALCKALSAQASAIGGLYDEARSQAPADHRARKALQPLAAYAVLHEVLLTEIQRKGSAELARGRITLPPLRKVWLAWRAQPATRLAPGRPRR